MVSSLVSYSGSCRVWLNANERGIDNLAEETRISDIDVLVLGGGIAATFAALKAKEAGANKVVLVDKGYPGNSGMSAFGAGWLWVYFPGEDNLDDMFRSMVRALGWLAQQELIMGHYERVYGIMHDMESYGVEFEKKPDGTWERRLGRGKHPGMHFRGPQLMEAMAKSTRKKGVELFRHTMITDLLVRNGEVHGAVGFNTRTGEFLVFESKATVMGTGSCWYKGRCPGNRDVTGDGAAIGFRAGATMAGSEWGDPSNLFPAHFDIGPGMNVYVGEGGKFINGKGQRFMEFYNAQLMDRSGLRLLVAAMSIEVRRGNGPIYMDMTHFKPEQLDRMRRVLPLAMMMHERAGTVVNNQFVKPIEWVPAAPIGRVGFVIDKSHATTLPGLYACGEAVARQARLEGITSAATSGATAGQSAAAYAKKTSIVGATQEKVELLKTYAFQPLQQKDGIEPGHIILGVQEAIFPYDVMFLRHEKRMQKALDKIEEIRDNQLPKICAYDPHYLRIAQEARNMVFVAEAHLRSCMMRKETRTILREDYPYEDNDNWLKWIDIKNDNGSVQLSTRDIPYDAYSLKPPKGRQLYYMWSQAQAIGAIRIEKGEVVWV